MSRSHHTTARREGHAKRVRWRELFNKQSHGQTLTPGEQRECGTMGYLPHAPRYGNNRKLYAVKKVLDRRRDRHKARIDVIASMCERVAPAQSEMVRCEPEHSAAIKSIGTCGDD